MGKRSAANSILLWAVALPAWAGLAFALYGLPGFGTNRSQPVFVLAGITTVIRFLMRGMTDAWPIAMIAAPALGFVTLMVFALLS
jgi:hypothetical protein